MEKIEAALDRLARERPGAGMLNSPETRRAVRASVLAQHPDLTRVGPREVEDRVDVVLDVLASIDADEGRDLIEEQERFDELLAELGDEAEAERVLASERAVKATAAGRRIGATSASSSESVAPRANAEPRAST
jgi:hypothetical protein